MQWIPLSGGGADLSQQVIVLGARKLRLTTKERDVLAYLARNPGRTVTRQELLVHVWGNPASGSHEPVYSVVKRLRAKVDRGDHQHIVGVHGDGYRWEPAPAPAPSETESPPPAASDPGAAHAPRERAPAGARFFGRGAELRAIAEAFDSGARVVTLVGPGGAGKTRCAIELGSRRAHVFCDLSSATTQAGVVAAVAAALDVPLDGEGPGAWTLGLGRAIAASPERLVVLDNAEQVIDVLAAMVASWIPLGPSLLVTSREPLRVRGEHVIPVGPLALDDAVSLFMDRAAAAGADPGDEALRARIVERVDCLPLALELAAAQVRELGAEALLSSLDSQLATLVAGARDAPSRHATLRAAVEWSSTFLGEREREVLGQLAVFAGSFTLQSARTVVDGPDAAAVLASLCRRCHVRRDGERFVLYAAVRELALERAGDTRAAEARHAAHFAHTGEGAAALLEGPRHTEGAARLSIDLAELRAAWTRSLDRDAVLAARLALVLDRALALRAESGGFRRDVLARSREGLEDPGLVCALLLAEGRTEGAPIALLQRACALATDPRVEAEIRIVLGERLAPTGLAAARAEVERALDRAHASTDALRGRALAALGEIAWAHGLVTEASARLRAALEAHVRAGDRRGIARTSALLAHVDRLETGGGAARALLQQAEAAAAELGEPVVRARVLLDLGQHLTRTGDQAGAHAALKEAALLYERVGFARDRAFLHLHVAETEVGIGDFDAALAEATAALSALPDPADVGRSTIYEAIGCIHLLRRDLAEGERWIEDGLAIARANVAARSECTLLGKRGLLHFARGAHERAWADFDEAARKNEARGASRIAGANLADRAMASFALGRETEAEADLARARELLNDSEGDGDQVYLRMLAICEIVGRAAGDVRRGATPKEAHLRARGMAARFFERVPPQEWDVVLRLADWLVDRIAAE